MLEILTRAGSFIAIIVLGFLLKKIGVFKEEDFSVLSKICIRITLPAAIITSFAGKEIDPSLLVLLFLGMGCGVLYILVGFLLNLRSSREKRAFEVLNLPGYNIGAFTMPFAQSFLGSMGAIIASLFDVGNAFVCLGGSYGVASLVKDGNGFSVKRLFQKLLTSVPFLCYVTMLVLNIARISLPDPVGSLAQIIGNANPFMAMFMIGVGFELTSDRSKLGTVIRIVSVRYVIAAALAVVCWFALPFSEEIRKALVILVFSPVSAAVPAFTQELKEDVGLSSSINSICIVISIVVIVALLSVMA